MTTKQHKKTISKKLILGKQTTSVLSILCLALMLVFLPNTAMSCYYSGLDYLKVTAGFGIKYHVTDDDDTLNCNIWAVSQPKSNAGFAFTLTKNGNDGGTFSNSWLGGEYSCEYKKYMFDTKWWSPVIVRAMKDDKEFKGEVKALIDEILPMIRTGVE